MEIAGHYWTCHSGNALCRQCPKVPIGQIYPPTLIEEPVSPRGFNVLQIEEICSVRMLECG